MTAPGQSQAGSRGLASARRLRVSVGPLFAAGDAKGGAARAGLLAMGSAYVRARPFFELLAALAADASWLRARFALASGPELVGHAEAARCPLNLRFSFRRGAEHPRLEMIALGLSSSWQPEVLRRYLSRCVVAGANAAEDVDAGVGGAVHRSPPIEHRGIRRFVLIATAGGPEP